jgi:tetratricopeptide (TPR) repeat protein
MNAAADWRMLRDDHDAAERLAREALNLVAHDPRAIGWSYFVLSSARYRQGQAAEAIELLDEGHAALDALHAPRDCHVALHGLASLFHLSLGDTEAARREADTQLEIARSTANPSMLTFALANAGRAWFSDDPDTALAAFEESVALTRAGASDGSHTQALGGAAQLRARRGERSNTLALLRTAIAFDHDVGVRANLGLTIERAIATLASIGDDDLAAMCAGVVQSKSVTTFRSLPRTDHTAARVADRLGSDAYEEAFARGATLAYPDVAPALLAEFDRVISKINET